MNLLSLYKIIFYINFYLFWYEKRIYSKWAIILKIQIQQILELGWKYTLSGHFVASFWSLSGVFLTKITNRPQNILRNN